MLIISNIIIFILIIFIAIKKKDSINKYVHEYNKSLQQRSTYNILQEIKKYETLIQMQKHKNQILTSYINGLNKNYDQIFIEKINLIKQKIDIQIKCQFYVKKAQEIENEINELSKIISQII